MSQPYYEAAKVIFDDTYGRGHGRDVTVTKFVSVFNLPKEAAEELFDLIANQDGK